MRFELAHQYNFQNLKSEKVNFNVNVLIVNRAMAINRLRWHVLCLISYVMKVEFNHNYDCFSIELRSILENTPLVKLSNELLNEKETSGKSIRELLLLLNEKE